jgi:predicted transcriptional regulator
MSPRRARPLGAIPSKREQQILDVVHRRGHATAAEIYADLPDAPSYNAVRATLRLMEEKGRVRHEREGRHYVYRAAVPARKAAGTALGHLLRTFFGGSAEALLSTLIEDRRPSEQELARMQRLIDEARTRKADGDGTA